MSEYRIQVQRLMRRAKHQGPTVIALFQLARLEEKTVKKAERLNETSHHTYFPDYSRVRNLLPEYTEPEQIRWTRFLADDFDRNLEALANELEKKERANRSPVCILSSSRLKDLPLDDLTFFSSDAFHLSEEGHDQVAAALFDEITTKMIPLLKKGSAFEGHERP